MILRCLTNVLCVLSICACLLVLNSCSQNSSHYPKRPITLICPWSAGGGTDRVARSLALEIESQLSVPVNVVNATGGGGAVGHTRMTNAAADGYTLGLATVEFAILEQRGLIGVGLDDVEPLAVVNADAAALFVKAESPWKSLKDFQTHLAQANQAVRASGTAAGGIWHLAFEGFVQTLEEKATQTTWVSINGSAPSMQELLAGGIDLVVCSLPEADALLSAGQIRCLGVMSGERIPSHPDVPTFSEQGFSWELAGWRCLVAPLGLDQEVLSALQEAAAKTLKEPSFQKFMADSGFNFSPITGSEARQFLQQSQKALGLSVNSVFPESDAADFSRYWFPILCAGALVICLITAVAQRSSGLDTGDVSWSRLLLGAAWAFLFILLLPAAGYLVAGCVFLLGAVLLLKGRWTQALVICLVAPASLYTVFAKLLSVPLPWGLVGW